MFYVPESRRTISRENCSLDNFRNYFSCNDEIKKSNWKSRNRKFRYSVWNFCFLKLWFTEEQHGGSRPWRCFKVLSFRGSEALRSDVWNSESRDMPLWRLVQGRVMEERLQRKLIPSRTSTVDNHFILISRKQPTEVNPGETICYNATFTLSSPPCTRRRLTGSRTELRVRLVPSLGFYYSGSYTSWTVVKSLFGIIPRTITMSPSYTNRSLSPLSCRPSHPLLFSPTNSAK